MLKTCPVQVKVRDHGAQDPAIKARASVRSRRKWKIDPGPIELQPPTSNIQRQRKEWKTISEHSRSAGGNSSKAKLLGSCLPARRFHVKIRLETSSCPLQVQAHLQEEGPCSSNQLIFGGRAGGRQKVRVSLGIPPSGHLEPSLVTNLPSLANPQRTAVNIFSQNQEMCCQNEGHLEKRNNFWLLF